MGLELVSGTIKVNLGECGDATELVLLKVSSEGNVTNTHQLSNLRMGRPLLSTKLPSCVALAGEDGGSVGTQFL
ncbi:MAG: hypothetical protein HXX08_00580 [Chloroflexi bacterium]|uniref:Uncharacterized protein n=1 Tax=Candidatus Chlorohelix allophototropha TaxID=3003348 RepID=A0A8T7LYE1_9CHLR|nr:hypothetical protein [Chloroflexota bacterium]WJW66243.1 hypothetical protein OZ401_002035 [Chloroflexota bacterium L227-S17]